MFKIYIGMKSFCFWLDAPIFPFLLLLRSIFRQTSIVAGYPEGSVRLWFTWGRALWSPFGGHGTKLNGVIVPVHFLCVCIKILSIEYKVTAYVHLYTRRLFDFISLFNVIRTKICMITHHTHSMAVIFWKVKYKEYAIALKKKYAIIN